MGRGVDAENSRRKMKLLSAIEALHLFGSVGIAALGWALARLLHFDPKFSAPLWLAGALLIYNIDRLKHDSADAINLPRRAQNNERFRHLRIGVALAAALTLVNIPLIMHDWKTLAIVVAGAGASLCYSIPIFGFRVKDVPLAKTFFVSAAIVVACLALPLANQSLQVSVLHFAVAALWAFAFVFFATVLCDVRDVAGDRATGIRSVPVVLGEKNTRVMLCALVVIVTVLAKICAVTAQHGNLMRWNSIALVGANYLAGLLVATRKQRGESFYAWWVEGMLFVPALALVAN
jgi:4-hydroxybenzoate polyprenyltransferase